MGESWKDSEIVWERLSVVHSNLTLYGADGVHFDDVNQGGIGNCWFIAACAAVAQIPGQVESLFLQSENQISPNGIYAVNFYSLGVPQTVIVDDYFATNGNGKLRFAGIADNEMRQDDGSLWVPIVEKAYAKYLGNYKHMSVGAPPNAIRSMNGGPSSYKKHNNSTGEELWDIELFSKSIKTD